VWESGRRRYLSHILTDTPLVALRTSGDLFICAKDLLVDSVATWAATLRRPPASIGGRARMPDTAGVEQRAARFRK